MDPNQEDPHLPWSYTTYLPEYYGQLDEYHEFILKCLNQFFKTYQPPAGKAKMLEFGGGAVLSNVISAAPSCKEIVFAEFREDNRQEVSRWLSKDPSAFQWQSFISYVVCTLEEGMEMAVDERKELLRNIIKVVPCDIFQPEPVEDQGPYDIILTAFCLEDVSKTNKEYTEGIAKLAHLVKPGGTLLMLSLENYCSWKDGDMADMHINPVSREFVREVIESVGFSHISMEFLPIEAFPDRLLEYNLGLTGMMFFAATKDAV